jgi:hypothetical protein
MRHLPKIYCEVIPHKKQRYDTAGDYFFGSWYNRWNFLISEMKNTDYEFLVLVHEIIEWHLTQKRGIKEEDITNFDIESKHPDPGTLKNAPYHKEHMFATKIEKQLAKELKINWNKYDKSFDKLKY